MISKLLLIININSLGESGLIPVYQHAGDIFYKHNVMEFYNAYD